MGRQIFPIMGLDATWLTPLAIALGAIPGALCRYFITQFCAQRWGSTFPYATFWINLSGTILMGWVSAVLSTKPSPYLQDLIMIGFLGAYTTFSTYALETLGLLKSHQTPLAVLYGLGSAVLSLFGVAIGMEMEGWVAKLR